MIVDTYEEASKEAFKIIKGIVVEKSNAVLGLATGSTPLGLYKEMIEDHKQSGTSYAHCQSFNLDEYIGLDRNHSETYWTFMHKNLFYGLDMKEENIHVPYGDSTKACQEYEHELERVQVDVQVLGIGGNGHIGFNEPGTSFDEETHIVTLASKTREDNARFFDNDMNQVPTQAITMGIKTIMKAKKILLIATGANKADAVKAMIEGEVDESCPASILQKHKDAVVILDKEAASKLIMK